MAQFPAQNSLCEAKVSFFVQSFLQNSSSPLAASGVGNARRMVSQGLAKPGREKEGRVSPLSFSFNILLFHSFPGAQAALVWSQGDELPPVSHPAPKPRGCRQSRALSGDPCLPQSGGQGTCSTGLATWKILIAAKGVGIESRLLGCHSLLNLHCGSSLSSGSSTDRS